MPLIWYISACVNIAIIKGRTFYENCIFRCRKQSGTILTCPDLIHLVKLPNITLPAPKAPERVKDADVLIINKVPINENTVGTAKNLKLVCVTATGTNNLIKTIWIPTKLPGETLPVIPQKQLLSIHLPCFSICLKSCAITMIM